MLKKLSYVSLAVSVLMMAYLYRWKEAFVPIPIDQSECPPNAGVAPDGTCGIYEGSRPSILLIVAGMIALGGLVCLMIAYKRRIRDTNKNKANK